MTGRREAAGKKRKERIYHNTGIIVSVCQAAAGAVLVILALQTDLLPVKYLALADALLGEECGAILMQEGMAGAVAELEGYEGFPDGIREIASYAWKPTVVRDTDDTDDTGEKAGLPESFVAYISGIDVFGDVSTRSRSDVNILAAVNTKTHRILLVSTPRDYYVPLPVSDGERDKLTHAGLYGVDVSMGTLEMLYGVEIGHYFRINFSGFEQLIDALGGVTVESAETFDVAPSFHYEKGPNELNGIEALAFARERHAFAQGDRQRGENQMAVIRAVVSKMQSPAVLQDFSGLMEGLSGSFETSIPYGMMSGLVKEQLSGGAKWEVSAYSVDGTGKRAETYSLHRPLYVMEPDYDTVKEAKGMIESVLSGEDAAP